jgi:methyl-accepting chemotaxis protein
MAIKHVKRAMKAWVCSKCGKKIKKGDPYVRCDRRYASNIIRCTSCGIRYSETRTSSKLQILYAVSENIGDVVINGRDDISTLAEVMREEAENIRQVAEEYRESAQNIEDGFGHSTYQSEELEEKAQQVEEWADEVERLGDEVESLIEEYDSAEQDIDVNRDNYKTEDEYNEAVEQAVSEARDDVYSQVEDKKSEADQCPV